MKPFQWTSLPAELHLAVVALLPLAAVRALARTSRATHALCLPALYAHVALRNAHALHAFARHVPARHAALICSLSVCTASADDVSCTDALVAVLAGATHLQSLSLSLAASIDPHRLIPAFAALTSVHTFALTNCGPETLAPVSERLVVSLAASLPCLSALSLSRISRSALHLGPCPPDPTVPLVLNDFDISPHPVLGSRLVLPALLSLSSLRVLEIRDTWLGCDRESSFDAGILPRARIERLVLTGNMYTEPELDVAAHSAWIRACGPALGTLVLGVPLVPPKSESDAPPPSPSLSPSPLPLPLPQSLSHLHINASLVSPDNLAPTLATLATCSCTSGVSRITVSYSDEATARTHADSDDAEFMRQCALDDLEDWKGAVETVLALRVEAGPAQGHEHEEGPWRGLRRVGVMLGEDVCARWETQVVA